MDENIRYVDINYCSVIIDVKLWSTNVPTPKRHCHPKRLIIWNQYIKVLKYMV